MPPVVERAGLRHEQQQRIHLRSSSQCDASSFSVSAGPSIHRLSLLSDEERIAVDQWRGLD